MTGLERPVSWIWAIFWNLLIGKTVGRDSLWRAENWHSVPWPQLSKDSLVALDKEKTKCAELQSYDCPWTIRLLNLSISWRFSFQSSKLISSPVATMDQGFPCCLEQGKDQVCKAPILWLGLNYPSPESINLLYSEICQKFSVQSKTNWH